MAGPVPRSDLRRIVYWFVYDLPDLGVGVFHVAEEHAAFRRCFNTCRQFAHGKPLGAEGAFFHHAFCPRRVFPVLILDDRRAIRIIADGISPVEAPRPVRTRCHAEPASDTTVFVLHRYTVRVLERRLRGTDPTQGGLSQWLHSDDERHVLDMLAHVLVFLARESAFVGRLSISI